MFKDLSDLLEPYGSLITVFGVLCSIALGMFAIHQTTSGKRQTEIEKQIASPRARKNLIDENTCSRTDAYFATTEKQLALINRFYGPANGARALSRCLSLAYFYPILFAWIGWIGWNVTSPGGIDLFHDVPSLLSRVFRTIITLGGFGAAALLVKTFPKSAVDRKHKVYNGTQRVSFLTQVLRWVIKSVGAVVCVVTPAAAAAVVSVGAVVEFVTVIGITAAVGVGAGAVAVIVAGAVAVAGVTGSSEFALLLFFYLILPYTNAAADWLSLRFTRGFLTRAVTQYRQGQKPRIGIHICCDLLLGVCCLALLIASLAGLLTLWGVIHPASQPFSAYEFWLIAQRDPTEGLALWLMCFTTLLPTLTHLVWFLILWWSQKSWPRQEAVRRMQAFTAEEDGLTHADKVAEVSAIARLIMQGGRRGFFKGTVLTIVLVAIVLGTAGFLWPDPASLPAVTKS